MRFFKFPLHVLETGMVSEPEEMLLFVRILQGAHHPDCFVTKNGSKIRVLQGEWLTSIREICEITSWGKDRAQRWLKQAVRIGLLETRDTPFRAGTIVSIRHLGEVEEDTGTQTSTRQVHSRDTDEDTAGTHTGKPELESKNLRSLESKNLRSDLDQESSLPAVAESNQPVPTKKTPSGYREGTTAIGEHKRVFITRAEAERLIQRFGKELVQTKIEALDASIETSPRKFGTYKNHYATLANWCRMAESPKTVHHVHFNETKTEQADRDFTRQSKDWREQIAEREQQESLMLGAE